MIIYAMFLCITSLNQCDLVSGPMGPQVFETRAECERIIPKMKLPNMAYRCLSRRVETWR